MVAFEKLAAEKRPAMVVVAGDVNSTLACSVVAAKANIPVAHLEAGLRSGDWTMPEEINRIVTDRLSQLHLTPSPDADTNLLSEGVSASSIVRVGNCMIDSLVSNVEKARAGKALTRFGVARGRFALATLHRPSNVDDQQQLSRLVAALREIGTSLPIVFPVHPRTRARLQAAEIAIDSLPASNVLLSEPLGYLDFLQLQDAAQAVITDSGGVQEETTALGVPCLTLRDNTERPITISEGTNKLIGRNPKRLPAEVAAILAGDARRGRIPELWDGKAGVRSARAIRAFLERHGDR
jgi:UDP-N-acetylglucosamine 2-epimerase (non-hydrolysing)